MKSGRISVLIIIVLLLAGLFQNCSKGDEFAGAVSEQQSGGTPCANCTMFADVQSTNPFYPSIETIYRLGITAGCSNPPLRFCPDAPLTRGQAAVMLLRAKYGSNYLSPAVTSPIFSDVPVSDPLAPWIHQLALLGITGGCTATEFCPNGFVTRAQIAVFLLRTKHAGQGYLPPPAQGFFSDVPNGHFARVWVEEIYRRGITAGCATAPLRYCPDISVSRRQLAVFLVKTFDL